jgi:hypothetical protein
MPLQATSGAASYDAFGGGVPVVPNYVEDVFSTYLYTGNNSTNAINNGIDLSTKGGLIWTKGRSAGLAGVNHWLSDTARGIGYSLASDSTAAQAGPYSFITLGTGGYSLNTTAVGLNTSGETYASWSWAKAPKFFDVVTYTGNGSTQNIAHNLGSTPGCIIVKEASAAGNDWQVYHRSTTNTCGRLFLNLTNAENANGRANTWGDNTNPVPPTSTVFTVGNTGAVNNNGATFVAYLFAHNAGGFGLTGTDNVISCGSFTTDGSGNATVSLGYEPQFIINKRSNGVSNWAITDIMRGMSETEVSRLYADSSNADSSSTGTNLLSPTATGFVTNGLLSASATYIYIAIRRGPMKVPTVGTSVFTPIVATSGTGTTNFPVDMQILSDKGSTNAILNQQFVDRLRGVSSTTTAQGNYLLSSSTAAESSTYPYSSKQWSNTGFGIPQNYEGASSLYLSFRRAPSFFDVVCWTSNATYPQVLNHNLTVAPELIIRKPRSISDEWVVGFDFQASSYKKMALNTTAAATSYGSYSSGEFPGKPTATQFTDQGSVSGRTFVAYLFATCAGVSKVGSYTGNGTTQTIDCGFGAGGARFVLIKRTEASGGWYVYDTARGMTALTDPYLFLNATDAEAATLGSVTTVSTGFALNSTILAAINVSSGTYIFLAIA